METLTPEQQLQQIEQQHQQRQETAPETESGYESMSRVAEQNIQQHEPTFQASSHAPRSVDESMPADSQSQVQQWVSDAFSKGVWQAIKEAKDANDPALLDSFHAALAGELYDRLVQAQQLKEVA